MYTVFRHLILSLFIAPWTFHLHVIKSAVLTRMFKVFALALYCIQCCLKLKSLPFSSPCFLLASNLNVRILSFFYYAHECKLLLFKLLLYIFVGLKCPNTHFPSLYTLLSARHNVALPFCSLVRCLTNSPEEFWKRSWIYFPNRLLLSFMTVWAFPNASRRGFTCPEHKC